MVLHLVNRLFRFVPINEDITTVNAHSLSQEVFAYMEKELKEAIPGLRKEAIPGHFSQGSAAALLVRAYLNAKVWTGVDRSADRMTVAQEIIDGKYEHSLSTPTTEVLSVHLY